MTTPEKADRLTEIAALLPQLIDEVQTLGKDSGEQLVSLADRARSNRRLIVGLAVSVAFDILLSVILLGFGFALHNSNDAIDTLTDRLNTAQTTQRQKALCPLYTLFLAADTPAARAAAKDKAVFDHSFVVVRQGYDALECAQFNGGAPSLGPTGKP